MSFLKPIVKKELKSAKSAVVSAIRRQFMGYRSHIPESDCTNLDRLHLGCGPRIMSDWINVDLYPQEGAFYLDATQPFPFPTNSLSTIHCEHFLEHLDYEDAVGCLAELYRILKPGGLLRLIVPDLNVYCQAYTRRDTDFFARLRHLGGSSEALDTPARVINQMFRMGGAHHFAWDEETLRQELGTTGFKQIELSSAAENTTEIDAQDDWRVLESLYLNVTK